jgi:hypothetical protein
MVKEEIGDSVAVQIEAKFPNLGRVELLMKMTLKRKSDQVLFTLPLEISGIQRG